MRNCDHVIVLTLILKCFVDLILMQAYREVVLLQACARTVKIRMVLTQ